MFIFLGIRWLSSVFVLVQVFSWSRFCSPSSVRVVILGQDPYHGPKQAHGLAFSVQRPVPPPPSLVNMFKEIKSSVQDLDSAKWPPDHGDLTGWACQGVLLLNAVLTVRASMANSHKDKGWELLTDDVVRYLNKNRKHLVFMLWGSNAQARGTEIDRQRHLVLQAPHPSPLSASRGFFGCGHFAKTNEYLIKHGQTPIKWDQLN
ncbi:Uracil-DNA glycosylase [Fasciolopsis buskii]|uniref:Uracil-DNA glycosylase n=1 Tax=Fasciolopsis buskii TaxID=27845 RepID=A0A8E0RPL7_9TREM|nr:Uracil-DNA glycosylase [Fasciolopsis buski]